MSGLPRAGAAQRFAIIGSPVAHSLSPKMQAAAFAATHLEATYEAIDVPPDRMRKAVQRLREERFAGWNVTTPLKSAIVALLDTSTLQAREAGAVNTVRREADGSLTGHNTDGEGLLTALADVWEWQPAGASVLLLGSGPAAQGIAAALRRARVAHVFCWSRNTETAARIGPPPAQTCDLIVSALPADACLPEDAQTWAGDGTYIIDLNYTAKRSPVAGLKAMRRSDGLPLLLHQGALAFSWWTGVAAPMEAMRTAIGR